MPKIRLDLPPETFEALTKRAVTERRPIDWQAEVLIESGLGLRDRPRQANRDIGARKAPVDAPRREEGLDAVP